MQPINVRPRQVWSHVPDCSLRGRTKLGRQERVICSPAFEHLCPSGPSWNAGSWEFNLAKEVALSCSCVTSTAKPATSLLSSLTDFLVFFFKKKKYQTFVEHLGELFDQPNVGEDLQHLCWNKSRLWRCGGLLSIQTPTFYSWVSPPRMHRHTLCLGQQGHPRHRHFMNTKAHDGLLE